MPSGQAPAGALFKLERWRPGPAPRRSRADDPCRARRHLEQQGGGETLAVVLIVQTLRRAV